MNFYEITLAVRKSAPAPPAPEILNTRRMYIIIKEKLERIRCYKKYFKALY